MILGNIYSLHLLLFFSKLLFFFNKLLLLFLSNISDGFPLKDQSTVLDVYTLDTIYSSIRKL